METDLGLNAYIMSLLKVLNGAMRDTIKSLKL
jgi:hypothetical protein